MTAYKYSLNMHTERRYLFFILIIGFILRIFMCFYTGLPHIHTDTRMYFSQAEAILKGSYINYAPNGYPIIIALFMIIFKGKALIISLLWLNIIFNTVSIYLVYNISRNLLNNTNAALISALILSLYPNQLNYTRWLLTEIPSVFFILASYNYYFENKRFLSGLFFGISSIMRPTLFPVWIAMIIYDWMKNKRIPWNIISGGCIITLVICTYAYFKTGEFSIAGNSKVNIIYSIYTFGGNIAWDAPQKHPEIKTSKEAKIAYIKEAFHHPLYFTEQRMASLWQLWGFTPSSLGESRTRLSMAIIGIENVFLIATAIYGFYVSRKKEKIITIILPVLIITFIHTMMLSIARYTVPMEPFLIVLSGYAIVKLISLLRY